MSDNLFFSQTLLCPNLVQPASPELESTLMIWTNCFNSSGEWSLQKLDRSIELNLSEPCCADLHCFQRAARSRHKRIPPDQVRRRGGAAPAHAAGPRQGRGH